MTTVTAKITAPGLSEMDLTASYTIAPAPVQSTAPAIPDGVYPMGSQGTLDGTKPITLKDYQGDWDFAKMGLDLSGWRIHGSVICRQDGIKGDRVEIVGLAGGSKGNALLDTNGPFKVAPNFRHITIAPTVSVAGVNAWMGNALHAYDFNFWGATDILSPNNLHSGKGPLDVVLDWGYGHDNAYALVDPTDTSHQDGCHCDGCQVPGGIGGMKVTRTYLTGITSPTRLDGAALRTKGPNGPAPSGDAFTKAPRPKGQGNSAIQITQHVSRVTGIVFDHCRLGGGEYATVNISSSGGTTPVQIAITNTIFDGNSFYGLDVGATKGTIVDLTGSKRLDGTALKVNLNG